MGNRRPALSPGVVKVRLSSRESDMDALADRIAALSGVEVLDRSRPRPNRYEPGSRVYMTVLVKEADDA